MTQGPPEQETKKLGRYTVLYELGRGAMGTVFRAHDPQIEREVALKTVNLLGLSATEQELYRQRFLREARAAGRLSHGGIVTIHDVGVDDQTQTPYLVMEFIQGLTLEQLTRGQPVPVEKALDLVQQIAEALDYAHQQQIVHRDIKPANILVTRDGRAKITDFGIAKLETAKFTQTGLVLGTPAYMSPEQLTAKPVDARSDIFSLGAILYELLTNKLPFQGDTLAALSYNVVHVREEPPSAVSTGLSPDFDYVVQRALAKDPAERYQSGRELADDLEDLRNVCLPRSRAAAAVAPAASAAAIAAPLSATIALEAPVPAPLPERRRRWLALLALGVLLFLLLGAGWWLWWRGDSVPEPELASPATQPTSAPARSPTTGGGRPTLAVATVRLQGEHNLDQGTLYVFADDKLVQDFALSGSRISASLRLPANTERLRIRVRGTITTGPSGWVPPGQRKKGRSSQSISIEQTESIRAGLRAGGVHTLDVRIDRDDLSLRWLN